MPERIITVDPATGEELTRYDSMSASDLDRTLDLVATAQQTWAATTLATRAKLLRTLATALRNRRREFAATITAEMGKPLIEAIAEIDKCAWVCDHYADHGPRLLAPKEVATGERQSWVCHEPLGVVLAVMPWNFPFWQVFRFAAPALMAGNTIVLKHAPNVTGSALAIEAVIDASGMPPGVLRTLLIAEQAVPAAVDGLIQDRRIAAVTMTGSNGAGSQVAAAAGRAAKKCVLELGGSDPFVVLEDADLDELVPKAVTARFLNAGQSCLCAKRFIVHEAVSREFAQRFARAVSSLTVGDPMEEATNIGPLARSDLAEDLHRQVATSIEAGATLLIGGHPLERGPAWYAPTVLTDVTVDMPVMAEETFGPAAAVISFTTDDDAVELANATPFGLGASVWSADPQRALSIGSRIESGTLFVNAVTASDPRLPFGGVKGSGHGRELGEPGATEFTNLRTIVIG